MIDALGESANTVAPTCPSPCDFKAFMQTLAFPRKGPKLKNPDGTNRKDAKGRPLYQWYPDYTKDFNVFTDQLFSDPEKAAKEIDNVLFTGRFNEEVQFKGAKIFDDIISEATKAIEKSQAGLVEAKRDPNGGWLKEIKNLLSIAANARRYNRAPYLTQEFKDWLGEKGLNLNVVMTDEIHRPPNFVYRKVDLDGTYDANRAVQGIQTWENQIKEFAVNQNTKGTGLGHVKCIRFLEDLERSLEDGCK